MKMVYVTASLPHGAGEAFIIPEVCELMRRGHEVLIVPRTPHGLIVHSDAYSLGNSTIKQPLMSGSIAAGGLSSLRHYQKNAWLALGLLRHSRDVRVLLKNLSVYPKGLWLAQICDQWGAEHIHAHWASTTATMALVASKVCGVPWSFTAHRWDIKENNLLKIKSHDALFVRTISENGARELSRLADYPRELVRVIHAGIDLPELSCAPTVSERDTPQDVYRVIVPANLVEVKGHRFVFQAIKNLVSRGFGISLDLAGDGPLRDSLVEYAHALGIANNVEFLGVVPHDELLSRMEQGEWALCVLPSIITADGAHEGIPVSLMEAMARKVPVISTNSGSIPELLDGGAGVIVPPGDNAALAEAIAGLLCDPALRDSFAEMGLARVQQEFAVEAVVDSLLANMQASQAKCTRSDSSFQ